MKSTVLFATLMAIAVPATAAPVEGHQKRTSCKAGRAPEANAKAEAAPEAQWWNLGANAEGANNNENPWANAWDAWRSRAGDWNFGGWNTNGGGGFPNFGGHATATAGGAQETPSAQPQPEAPAAESLQAQPQPPAQEQEQGQQEQPAPSAEQPAEQPQVQPSASPVKVDDPPAEQPTEAPTAAGEPGAPLYTTAVEEKKAGEPQLPYINDQTTATESSTEADIAGTSKQAKVALDYHNKWRAQFGSGPVTWDPELARSAAQNMGTCKWEHAGADNLSALWASGDKVNHFIHNFMDGWANEWKIYDWNNPGFAMSTGHFTAMTWKGVTKIGCGWKIGCKDSNPGAGFEKKMYFSCVYDPAPNMAGINDEETKKIYTENVGKYTGN